MWSYFFFSWLRINLWTILLIFNPFVTNFRGGLTEQMVCSNRISLQVCMNLPSPKRPNSVSTHLPVPIIKFKYKKKPKSKSKPNSLSLSLCEPFQLLPSKLESQSHSLLLHSPSLFSCFFFFSSFFLQKLGKKQIFLG